MKKIIFSIAMFFSNLLISGVLIYDVSHNSGEIQTINNDQYDYISLQNGRYLFSPGDPSLPSIVCHYLIPSKSMVTSVEILNPQWVDLGRYNIYPTQRNFITNTDPVYFTEKSDTYKNNSFFPENPLISFNPGNKAGFILTGIVYCPFRYNPVTRQLQFLQNASIKITYYENAQEEIFLSELQWNVHSQVIQNLVSNPEDINRFAPPVKTNRYPGIPFLIITPECFSESFDRLIEWYRLKGIFAGVVTTEFIGTNYSGCDLQEKIRNYLQQNFNSYELLYVLFVGKQENIYREAYLVCNDSFDHQTPSDLYFSDILPVSIGTVLYDWDTDNDYRYGEVRNGSQGDICDYYSDVYVGRLPVSTTQDIDEYIDELLIYQQNPPLNFIQKSVMAGGQLAGSFSGANLCDLISDNILPSNWTDEKYYWPNNTPFLSPILSQGFGWCQIHAHGLYNSAFWDQYGNNSMFTGTNLSNGNKTGVILATSCLVGRYNSAGPCVVENIFNNTNGGAIAVIMNTSFGTYNTYCTGPSERLCQYTASYLFNSSLWNIGIAHAVSKDCMVPEFTGQTLNLDAHFSVNSLNFFGDPSTQIYSMDPTVMSVSHDQSIFAKEDTLHVHVINSLNQPIQNALCCLSLDWQIGQRDLSYYTVETDANGNADIIYQYGSESRNITAYLTTTAHNHYFCQDTFVIQGLYWPHENLGYQAEWGLLSSYGNLNDSISGSFIYPLQNGEYLFSVKTPEGISIVNLLNNGSYVIGSNHDFLKEVFSEIEYIYVTQSDNPKYICVGKCIVNNQEKGIIRFLNSDYEITKSELLSNGVINKIIPFNNQYVVVGEIDGKCWAGKFSILSLSSGDDPDIGDSDDERGNFMVIWNWKSSNLSWNNIPGELKSVIKFYNQIIAVGRTNSGSCLFYIGETGNLNDTLLFNDGTGSIANDVIIDYSNYIIIVGKKNNVGAYAKKINSDNFSIVWQKEFSVNSWPWLESFKSLILDPCGNYIAGGDCHDVNFDCNTAIIAKINKNTGDIGFVLGPLNQYWGNTYFSKFNMMSTTSNDGIVLIGTVSNTADYTNCFARFQKYTYNEADIDIDLEPLVNNNSDQLPILSNICHLSFTNKSLQINLIVNQPTLLDISVYNVLGQKVKALYNDYASSGFFEINWNLTNNNNNILPSGKYFIKFTADNFNETRSLTIIE